MNRRLANWFDYLTTQPFQEIGTFDRQVPRKPRPVGGELHIWTLKFGIE